MIDPVKGLSEVNGGQRGITTRLINSSKDSVDKINQVMCGGAIRHIPELFVHCCQYAERNLPRSNQQNIFQRFYLTIL